MGKGNASGGLRRATCGARFGLTQCSTGHAQRGWVVELLFLVAANHCGTPLPASRSSAVQSFGDEISAVRQSRARQYWPVLVLAVLPEWCCHSFQGVACRDLELPHFVSL